MELSIETTPLPGVLVISHQTFEDPRGFFMEVYRRDLFATQGAEQGLPEEFVQLNHSRSARNVLRGLHFQWQPPMGKLMRVTSGTAFLVAVDLRQGSPTQGQSFGLEVSASSHRQVWAPASFARGFCVLSESADIQYLCTGTYNQAGEAGILWNDPALGIEWPVDDPIVSEKDRSAPTLQQWLERSEADNFRFTAGAEA